MHCIIPLCQQVRNIFRRENGVLGTENDAHEKERFNPASRLCPSRVSLPSVLPHGCKERQTPTRGSSAQDGRLLVLAARVRSDSDRSDLSTFPLIASVFSVIIRKVYLFSDYKGLHGYFLLIPLLFYTLKSLDYLEFS